MSDLPPNIMISYQGFKDHQLWPLSVSAKKPEISIEFLGHRSSLLAENPHGSSTKHNIFAHGLDHTPLKKT